MAIDAEVLAQQMLDASLAVLKGQAPLVSGYLRTECAKIAEAIVAIELGLQTGQMGEDEARVLVEMYASAKRSVSFTAEGLSELAVEEAMNAALDVARSVANAALGFALI
jgi:hypothetical protein